MLIAPTARAALILYEPFDYSAGDLSQATTGTVWSRTGTGDSIQVVDGNLSHPNYPTSTGRQVQWGGDGRISRTDFTAVTSGSIFASFLYRMDDIGSLTTTGGAVAGMVNAANTANPNSRVYIRRDAANPNAFNFGVLEKYSAVNWGTSQMTLGITYMVVFSLDFIAGDNNDTARLWINPAEEFWGAATPPTASLTATGGADSSQVNRFRLIQNPSNGSATLQSFDELRIGTSWSDVVMAPSVEDVPEPSSLMLGAIGTTLMLARRRRL